MTVLELRERALRAMDLAGADGDPQFRAAVLALPDTTKLRALAPECRKPIEDSLRVCSDFTPETP